MQWQLSHLIAQTTTDAFVAIDPENRVIYWNRGAEQLLGWTADEIIGQSLHLIIPRDKQEQHDRAMRGLSDGSKPRMVGKTGEVIAHHRDGHEVVVELSLTLWRDELTGRPAGYASIMRDVSERRKVQQERDAYGRQLEEQIAAVEATTDGVAITDTNGCFIFMNPAHATMFGFGGSSETIGMHWSSLYTPEEAERIGAMAVPQVMETGHWRGEARGLHRDGSVIEQEITLSKSPGGGLVCTTRDIGERQRSMRERIQTRERLLLAERQEMIGRAVSGLAHDFANLMSVITVSAATLGEGVAGVDRELSRIQDAATQATAMLEKILAPDRARPSGQRVEAKSALQSVAELTAVTLRPQHIFRLDLPEEGFELAAERTEFMQIMMNLCTNARDALPAEAAGSIELRLEKFVGQMEIPAPIVGSIPMGPKAVITVTDSGCGIAAEDLGQIFEPFQTRKSYGTGLGLAVVSALIAKLGGSVSVESGRWGTCFTILCPIAGATSKPRASLDRVTGKSLVNRRILVTDDNPAVLDLITAELQKAGAEVGPCETPSEALSVLEDEASNWDALVVDYDMPEMNGAELASAVRAQWPKLPIILCSALQEAEGPTNHARLFDARVMKSALGEDLPRQLRLVLSTPELAS